MYLQDCRLYTLADDATVFNVTPPTPSIELNGLVGGRGHPHAVVAQARGQPLKLSQQQNTDAPSTVLLADHEADQPGAAMSALILGECWVDRSKCSSANSLRLRIDGDQRDRQPISAGFSGRHLNPRSLTATRVRAPSPRPRCGCGRPTWRSLTRGSCAPCPRRGAGGRRSRRSDCRRRRCAARPARAR